MAWKRIVNASPLIFLNSLGMLELLRGPDIDVLVPDAVLDELSYPDPHDPAAFAARSAPWIRIVPTPPIPALLKTWKLGKGETAVLAVALQEMEMAVDLDVVLDDLRARRCAASLRFRVQGTLACLMIAKATGKIGPMRPILGRLRRNGMYISDQLFEYVLGQVGE